MNQTASRPAAATAQSSAAALALIEIAEARNLPFGHEYSTKLCAGQMHADRHLLTLPREAFGDHPDQLLALLSSRLGLAHAWHGRMAEDWKPCSHIHLGVESQGETRIWKVYFEASQAYEDAVIRPGPAWCRVHRGYKWLAGAPDSMVVSQYDALIDPAPQPRLALIAEALGSQPPLQDHFGQWLLGLPRQFTSPMLLRVSDENSSRVSVDVNLYPFGLTVGSIGPLLLKLAACCAVPSTMIERWLEHYASEALGHLAAGCRADGRPFVTIYCGMDEWAG